MTGLHVRPPPGESGKERHQHSRLLVTTPGDEKNGETIQEPEADFVASAVITKPNRNKQEDSLCENPAARLTLKCSDKSHRRIDKDVPLVAIPRPVPG